MENVEAINRLDALRRENPMLLCADVKAIYMAISALEKQEGKKPKEARNIYPPEQFECPVCGCCVGRHKTLRRVNDLFGEVLTDCVVEFDFSPDCGQRIDWSDENVAD